MQPTGQRVTPPDRSGELGQHQERGLKRVLGIVMISHDLIADPLDHGPMPLHRRSERRLIPSCHKELQQLRIGQPGDRPILKQDAQAARAEM